MPKNGVTSIKLAQDEYDWLASHGTSRINVIRGLIAYGRKHGLYFQSETVITAKNKAKEEKWAD